MNYKQFRFRAVIDWLEFEFETREFTNFQSVNRLLNSPYVQPLDKGDGGRASKFSFKFHDPKNWVEIQNRFEILNEKFPLIDTPKVKSIEVSIDAYSRTADKLKMHELIEIFFRSLAKPVSLNTRFSGLKGSKEKISIASRSETRKLISEGRNICIGNIEHDSYTGKKIPADDEYMQIYYKTTDNNGKTLLPAIEHRARIEIRLSDKALPFTTIEEGKLFKFELLTKYFRMRNLNHLLLKTAPKGVQKAFELVSQLGTVTPTSKRKNAVITVADTQLNDKFYDSLRELSRRMQSAQKAGKI